ncbi:MAG: ATP-binding protein [Hadesarchaea archaeon]|nr:ATP-binding protein [Hadesarchaea archaeon]
MKEIVVASGKGGTGKTTVAASLAVFLAKRGVKVFTADADVDAPDLLLVLGGGKTLFSTEVRESEKAEIDKDRCTSCGKCVEVCPFGAIVAVNGERPAVVELMCEGCGVCKLVCPAGAIEVKKAATGTLSVEETKYGFGCATGKLRLGEHNSGHLVASIKNIGRRKAQDTGSDAFIVDAAPGIGCPVIASITGADYVIAVTEPTPAAKRNLERLARVIKHFGVPAGVVINMSGYSRDFEAALKDWVVRELGFQLLGEIPVDYEVVKALVQMKPIIEFNPDTKASKALAAIAKQIREIL